MPAVIVGPLHSMNSQVGGSLRLNWPGRLCPERTGSSVEVEEAAINDAMKIKITQQNTRSLWFAHQAEPTERFYVSLGWWADF